MRKALWTRSSLKSLEIEKETKESRKREVIFSMAAPVP